MKNQMEDKNVKRHKEINNKNEVNKVGGLNIEFKITNMWQSLQLTHISECLSGINLMVFVIL